MANTQGASRNRRLIRLFLWVESYLFPLIFLLLALNILWSFARPLEQPVFGAETYLELANLVLHPSERPAELPLAFFYISFVQVAVRPALLLVFNLLCAGLIALRTRLQYEPASLREVLIPLCATFFMALMPLASYLPQ